jgi:hypothetical protein
MEEILKHEDVWIFLVLIILIINTFIILWIMSKESKKTDLMYSVLSEIGKNNRELIENNAAAIANDKKIAQDNSNTNAAAIADNKKDIANIKNK